MAALKKCFYKFLFRWVIRNKHKRKQLYICLPKTGIAEYRRLSRLSSEENRENRAFKYFMSIACIIKNEGPYLREWLEYHKLIGVEHFYVYDNESSDNTKEVLQPYIDAGDVTYIYFPGKGQARSGILSCNSPFRAGNQMDGGGGFGRVYRFA